MPLQHKLYRPTHGGSFSCAPFSFKGDRITVKGTEYYWHKMHSQYQKCPVIAQEKRAGVKKAQQRNFQLMRLRGARRAIQQICYDRGIRAPTYVDGFFDMLEKIILRDFPSRP